MTIGTQGRRVGRSRIEIVIFGYIRNFFPIVSSFNVVTFLNRVRKGGFYGVVIVIRGRCFLFKRKGPSLLWGVGECLGVGDDGNRANATLEQLSRPMEFRMPLIFRVYLCNVTRYANSFSIGSPSK